MLEKTSWRIASGRTYIDLFLMVLTLYAGLFASAARAQDFQTDIMTGGASGTYIQIGRDIATLAEQIGRNVVAVESAGSLENI
jgi:uncharacterized protein